jgi:AraC family transcriptional regulator, regulatory protein of adaptative response / methylated-DNA-[protein]-cysteine methyltransferase
MSDRLPSMDTLSYSVGTSSLGWTLVAWTDNGVCAVLLGDSPAEVIADLEVRFPDVALVEEYSTLVDTIIASIDDPSQPVDAPLDLRGTDLQQRVWRELRTIPVGATASYGEVAKRIGGAPRGAKDVADACAANALAVLVPCHRVIRSNGALAGYRWGVRRKRALLAREARVINCHHAA